MSRSWSFNHPLDDITSIPSNEEKAKITSLFNRQDDKPNEELNYVTTFEKQKGSKS